MFLSLDDMLDEGKHIDLERPSRRGGSGRRSSMGVSAVTMGVSDGGFSCFGDDEKEPFVGSGRVSDISRPPMFLMEQDYGNSFKMSTCAVDPVSVIEVCAYDRLVAAVLGAVIAIEVHRMLKVF